MGSQVLEELHKNPELAADPEQQLQFKRLAQQQLLYQMALASQAAAPDGTPDDLSEGGDGGDGGGGGSAGGKGGGGGRGRSDPSRTGAMGAASGADYPLVDADGRMCDYGGVGGRVAAARTFSEGGGYASEHSVSDAGRGGGGYDDGGGGYYGGRGGGDTSRDSRDGWRHGGLGSEFRHSFERLAELVDDERSSAYGERPYGDARIDGGQWDEMDADNFASGMRILGGGAKGGSGRKSHGGKPKNAALLALDLAAESVELSEADFAEMAGGGGGGGHGKGAKGQKRAWAAGAGAHGVAYKRVRVVLGGACAAAPKGKYKGEAKKKASASGHGGHGAASAAGGGRAHDGASKAAAAPRHGFDGGAAPPETALVLGSSGSNSSSNGMVGSMGGSMGGGMGGGAAGASAAGGSTGGKEADGERERAPPKRRGWLTEREEQEALSNVKFPPSAASARLLRQLADFNPSGKEDSAPNVLLPNEHDAKERGESWRLPETDLLAAANAFRVHSANGDHPTGEHSDGGHHQAAGADHYVGGAPHDAHYGAATPHGYDHYEGAHDGSEYGSGARCPL